VGYSVVRQLDYFLISGPRKVVWQAPHVGFPTSAIAAFVASALPVLATSTSFVALTSRFLAFPSNSDHFCQISGLDR
jgi:hypothetical protein